MTSLRDQELNKIKHQRTKSIVKENLTASKISKRTSQSPATMTTPRFALLSQDAKLTLSVKMLFLNFTVKKVVIYVKSRAFRCWCTFTQIKKELIKHELASTCTKIKFMVYSARHFLKRRLLLFWKKWKDFVIFGYIDQQYRRLKNRNSILNKKLAELQSFLKSVEVGVHKSVKTSISPFSNLALKLSETKRCNCTYPSGKLSLSHPLGIIETKPEILCTCGEEDLFESTAFMITFQKETANSAL